MAIGLSTGERYEDSLEYELSKSPLAPVPETENNASTVPPRASQGHSTEAPTPDNYTPIPSDNYTPIPFDNHTPITPDDIEGSRRKLNELYWKNIPEDKYRERIRGDAERNEIAVPIWKDWNEYKKIWEEERGKVIENDKLFNLSPKQLREKGIKPSSQNEAPVTMSDASPDAIKPGQQYAQMKTPANQIINSQMADPFNPVGAQMRSGGVPGLPAGAPGMLAGSSTSTKPVEAIKAPKPTGEKQSKLQMVASKERSIWDYGSTPTKSYEFVDSAGKTHGEIHIVDRGDKLKVEWAENYGGINKKGNKLEAAATYLDLLKQIKRLYPEAKEIYGLRISGARGASASDKAYQRVRLPELDD